MTRQCGRTWALGWGLQPRARPKFSRSRSSAAHESSSKKQKKAAHESTPCQHKATLHHGQPNTEIAQMNPTPAPAWPAARDSAILLPVPGDGVTGSRRGRSGAQDAKLGASASASASRHPAPTRRSAVGSPFCRLQSYPAVAPCRRWLAVQQPAPGRLLDPNSRSREGGQRHHSPAHCTAPALLCCRLFTVRSQNTEQYVYGIRVKLSNFNFRMSS